MGIIFIQRGCNELYLQWCWFKKRISPVKRDHAPNAGWLERVDPMAMETIERSRFKIGWSFMVWWSCCSFQW